MNNGKWAMLCKLRVEAFTDPGWTWERKLDGCRMLLRMGRSGLVTLTARSGADKTSQFPELMAIMPSSPGCVPLALDGEVVSADGLSFQEFNQRRMNRVEDIASFSRKLPAVFVAFDMLSCAGKDISNLSLDRRKALLGLSVQEQPFLKVASQHEDGVALFEKANADGWEGVVGKMWSESYMPHKRRWVKVKRWLEGVFECIGYTLGIGKRAKTFGALVVRSADGKLKAEVGTGFDGATLASLLEFMRKRQTGPMLAGGAMPALVGVNVKPFRVRVKYVEVTNAGSLRFPVYMGLDAST